MRLVVVGNGMVGSRFVEDLLAADHAGKYEVTVLGAEACEPYNRVLLSEVVAGAYDLAALTLPTPEHPRLRVRRGSAAVALDREDRVVVDSDGLRHRYDQVVLATGAVARIPPLAGLGTAPGSLVPGVHALRTIDDAREIVAATYNATSAVVLGAGVLGLEVACGLARRGCGVTVVHPAPAMMERQLDGPASQALEGAMSRLGIDHRVGVGADGVRLERGRLGGVHLAGGEVLPADLLVVATGTVVDTSLAAAAGLPTGRGVLVGDDLASPADRRVFAIGDCAQPPEGGTGLVAQGWEQARRLAAALTAGTGEAVAGPSASAVPTPGTSSPGTSGPGTSGPGTSASGTDVVRLKAHGLDVVAMGVCGSARADDPAQRSLRLSDPGAGRHVEVVVSGDRLVGATCVGAGQVAADLVAAYTRRTPLPADPAYLLLPALAPARAGSSAADPTSLPDDATVCRCNGVSKGAITGALRDGAQSLDEVARATRATTGCGGCTDDVCALVDALTPHRDRSEPVKTV